MVSVPVVVLRPGRHLTQLRHEMHGRAHAYVVADRFGTIVLVCQKLPLAAAYLNATTGGDRIAVASLYEAAARGRLVHRRWTCKRTTLDEAPAAFAEARQTQPDAKSVVLGWPDLITVKG